MSKLSDFQKRVLRETSLADRSETALREWMSSVMKSSANDVIAALLNKRMDELAEPALSGRSCTEEQAVDYAIAIAASIQFGRLVHLCVFDEGCT